MANELQADSNTYVGYSHITGEFYVRKDYAGVQDDAKTAAKSATDAKLILDVIAPGNNIHVYPVLLGEVGIADLPKRYEPVTSISYTLEDTGKYIKNVYFNEYKAFAIQYDEPNLYIRGSNEMWDMSSTIEYKAVAEFMMQYYINYIGIFMPQQLMYEIVKYFKNIQKPYVYNVIATQTDEEKLAEEPLMYTNSIKVSNANKTARGEYEGVKNPNNVYNLNIYKVESIGSTTKEKRYNVTDINKSSKKIYLAEEYPNVFAVNNHIRLQGTAVEGLDGDYTIAEINHETWVIDGQEITKYYLKIAEDEEFVSSFSAFYTQEILMKLDSSGNPELESVTGNIITCADAEPECVENLIIQLVGNRYKKNLTVDKVGKGYNPSNELKSLIYTKEPVSDAGTNASLNETKVYTNAYSIMQCGYDNYVEIKNSMVISKTSGNNVYLKTPIASTDYAVGETVYIDMGDGIDRPFVISAVIATSTGTSSPYTYNEGYITLTATPPAITGLVGGNPAYLQVRNNTKKSENSFKLDLTNNATMPVNVGETFYVTNSGNTKVDGEYVVESISGSKIFVVRENDDEALPELLFNENNRAILQIRTYSERILLNMLYSRSADKMPMGSFTLDNNEQFTNYLNLYKIVTPTSQNYADFNQPVNMKYYLGQGLITEGQDVIMNCVGLYSDVYGEEQ